MPTIKFKSILYDADYILTHSGIYATETLGTYIITFKEKNTKKFVSLFINKEAIEPFNHKAWIGRTFTQIAGSVELNINLETKE